MIELSTSQMRLKTDYRKLNAIIFIGLVFGSLAILMLLKTDGNTRLVWTIFFGSAFFLYIAMGLLTKSQFHLTKDSLELTNLIGLGKKKLSLQDIDKVRTIDREFPHTANGNILWFFLWDKKFKRIKRIELYSGGKRIANIDGHFIDDKDYEILKRKLR
jgi:hypothetical protein